MAGRFRLDDDVERGRPLALDSARAYVGDLEVELSSLLVELRSSHDASAVILLDLELIGSARAVCQSEIQRGRLLVALVPVNFVVFRITDGLPL